MARDTSHEEIEGFERVFDVVGWLGFLAVVPVALRVFGLPQLQDLMQAELGRYGSPGFLLLVFFGLVFLRVIFGSGRVVGPLIIGSLMGFLLIAPAAGVGFMNWLRELEQSTPYLANLPLSFLVGLAVVLLGILLSSLRRLPVIVQVLLLVVLPIVFLLIAGHQGWLSGLAGPRL
jgi:hypothetical protein